eukprot:TRINITY_DN500_c0_g2_i1.p3 TRINITY_DN500_c0_g2~~TRINITY_DN500_c0_g2_i1.p3  ORF type:complete len:144 (+),score=16.72 TRINITY_DN500_c0_g2_i1:811-1242(+)
MSAPSCIVEGLRRAVAAAFVATSGTCLATDNFACLSASASLCSGCLALDFCLRTLAISVLCSAARVLPVAAIGSWHLAMFAGLQQQHQQQLSHDAVPPPHRCRLIVAPTAAAAALAALPSRSLLLCYCVTASAAAVLLLSCIY